MTVEVWPNKEKRDQFFDELRALIARYPNIGDHMAREYAEDPTSFDTMPDSYPTYNSESPVYLEGIIVIVTHANMENFETLAVLEPYSQSHYLSNGMLSRAGVVHGVGEE